MKKQLAISLQKNPNRHAVIPTLTEYKALLSELNANLLTITDGSSKQIQYATDLRAQQMEACANAYFNAGALAFGKKLSDQFDKDLITTQLEILKRLSAKSFPASAWIKLCKDGNLWSKLEKEAAKRLNNA